MPDVTGREGRPLEGVEEAELFRRAFPEDGEGMRLAARGSEPADAGRRLRWEAVLELARRALWALGLLLLISSARTTLANSGPGEKTNDFRSASRMCIPMMSWGRRSLVNWIRRKVPEIPEERARASVVLPVPGTSSRRTWPPAMKEAIARSTDSFFPRRTVSMFTRNSDSSSVSGFPSMRNIISQLNGALTKIGNGI